MYLQWITAGITLSPRAAMASAEGPRNWILVGVCAKAAGSSGFSEA